MLFRSRPGLNHPELFGTNGCISVSSKGLGKSGLVFKNTENNRSNLYVRMLTRLLEAGLEQRLQRLSEIHGGTSLVLLGEIFGAGVQDLHYGTREPQFRAFDLRIGFTWADPVAFAFDVSGVLMLDLAPTVYEGEYEEHVLRHHAGGSTRLGEHHIREGIVVRSLRGDRHPLHGRKIAKFISPDYLTRKRSEEHTSELQSH